MQPFWHEKVRTLDLGATDCRLDIDTTFERVFLIITIILFFFTGSLIYYKQPMENFWVASVLCVISMIICRYTDASYFINNKKCSIDYSSYFFGLGYRYRVCYFDEIDSVAVNSTVAKFSSRYTISFTTFYSVVIVTNKGRIIRVTDLYDGAIDKCNQTATRLAKHFNAKFIPGEPGHQVHARLDRRKNEVVISLKNRWWRLWGVLSTLCFFAIVVFLFYARDNGAWPEGFRFLDRITDIDVYEAFDALVKFLKNLVIEKL